MTDITTDDVRDVLDVHEAKTLEQVTEAVYEPEPCETCGEIPDKRDEARQTVKKHLTTLIENGEVRSTVGFSYRLSPSHD